MQPSPENTTSPGDTTGGPREDARAGLSELKAQGSQAAQQVRDSAAGAAEKVKAHGSEMLQTARDRAEGLAESGKEAGQQQISGFAKAIRHAAEDLDESSPEIANHVRAAAGSIEELSSALRDRSVGQLVQDATNLARRQPVAFFGVAAIAGFAIARFAKSSGRTTHAEHSRHASPAPEPHRAPGWVQSPDDRGARPATMAAATLGGAAAHRPGEAAPGSMPTRPSEPAHQHPGLATPHVATPGHADPVPNERTGSQL